MTVDVVGDVAGPGADPDRAEAGAFDLTDRVCERATDDFGL
jgi:hypothetical protein